MVADDFKAGKYRAICNVNVYAEGFNATCVDCIVLLRPTLSAGLFSQMVGRGLRLHGVKEFCLVLDFAGCIEEHGPIDMLGNDAIKMAVWRTELTMPSRENSMDLMDLWYVRKDRSL